MANYIALHVFYGTSYLISNYKYISYAIFLIPQDLVLSPVVSLGFSFQWFPLAVVWGTREHQSAVLQIVSCVMYEGIWLGWYTQPLKTSITLLADTGMLDFRRKCGRHWAPLAFTVVSVQVQWDIGAPAAACVTLPIYFLCARSISWTL